MTLPQGNASSFLGKGPRFELIWGTGDYVVFENIWDSISGLRLRTRIPNAPKWSFSIDLFRGNKGGFTGPSIMERGSQGSYDGLGVLSSPVKYRLCIFFFVFSLTRGTNQPAGPLLSPYT